MLDSGPKPWKIMHDYAWSDSKSYPALTYNERDWKLCKKNYKRAILSLFYTHIWVKNAENARSGPRCSAISAS